MKGLLKAISFRELCRTSDTKFRQKIHNFETKNWQNELSDLTSPTIKTELIVQAFKEEPLEEIIEDDVQDNFNDIEWPSFEDDQPIRSITKEPSVQCPKCDHVASNKKNLKYHMMVKHDESGQSNVDCHVSCIYLYFWCS